MRHDVPVLARVVLAAVAVLVLAWVGVLARDHDVQMDAAVYLFYHPRVSAERLTSDMGELEDAEFLNPDTSPQLARARLYALHGQPVQAARVARSLATREPDNFEAWAVLRSTAPAGSADARRAAAALARLDPLLESRR